VKVLKEIGCLTGTILLSWGVAIVVTLFLCHLDGSDATGERVAMNAAFAFGTFVWTDVRRLKEKT
jgi:hypothetical protein